MNIGVPLTKLLQTLEKDKKVHDDMLKEAKGNKEVEGLLKNLQKLTGQQKKALQDIEKALKKSK